MLISLLGRSLCFGDGLTTILAMLNAVNLTGSFRAETRLRRPT